MTANRIQGMALLMENLDKPFPLNSDDSDDARDKTLKYWTAEDFRNAEFLGEKGTEMAEMLEEAGVRNLGEIVGREGPRA